jgi:CelD/BcsL family acetyltransferase involved in cellulose biosynthesis
MSSGDLSSLCFDPKWVESWAGTLGRGEPLHALEVSDAGAALVLAEGRYEGFRCLRFPGATLAPDCEEFPMGVDETRQAALSWSLEKSLRDSGADALLLRSVREGSPTLSWAERLDGRNGLRAVIRPTAEVFVATLAEDWQKQAATLRPKLVADTNRCLRRLEERGPIRFERVTTQPEASDAIVFIARHQQALLDARGQHSMFDRPEFLDFCQRMVGRFLDDPRLHLSRLMTGERVAAAHLGYRIGERFYYSLPSFDRELAKYAPGRLLLFWLMEHAIGSGARTFDLGPGDEPYKHEFGPRRSPLFTVVVYRAGVRGRLAGQWFGRLRPTLARLSPTAFKRWLSRAGISRH